MHFTGHIMFGARNIMLEHVYHVWIISNWYKVYHVLLDVFWTIWTKMSAAL